MSVSLAPGAGVTAEGTGVNNRLGIVLVGTTGVADAVDVALGLDVTVEPFVGVEVGVAAGWVFAGEMIGAAVGVGTEVTTATCGSGRLTATTVRATPIMLTSTAMKAQRRVFRSASSRIT